MYVLLLLPSSGNHQETTTSYNFLNQQILGNSDSFANKLSTSIKVIKIKKILKEIVRLSFTQLSFTKSVLGNSSTNKKNFKIFFLSAYNQFYVKFQFSSSPP